MKFIGVISVKSTIISEVLFYNIFADLGAADMTIDGGKISNATTVM